MVIVDLFKNKLSVDKINKVIQVSNDLNINPNWLLAVMYFESAKTFNPAIKNNIGSVGLIQFTRDKAGVEYKTINGKRYNLSALAQMSFIQQMDVVKQYYKGVYSMLKINKMNSFVDVYLCTFFPLAVGKPDNYVFQTSGLSASKIAQQNPIFDKNKDNQIQKNEVVKHFETYYKEVFKDINIQDTVNSSNIISKVCAYCKQSLPYVLPVVIFFYTIVTVIL